MLDYVPSLTVARDYLLEPGFSSDAASRNSRHQNPKPPILALLGPCVLMPPLLKPCIYGIKSDAVLRKMVPSDKDRKRQCLLSSPFCVWLGR